ncbi:isochorismate synthase [Nesterenkonia alba]|uniref:isochorismate synthase n=1 Tax=Nesterenkonia alba TaxID=515814 RepID=UPI0003B6CE7C|nr:isochorismate synthase [Nesterenkonia alba]
MSEAAPHLSIREVPVQLEGTLTDLLPHLDPSGVWLRDDEGLVGLGVAAARTARGTRRFAELSDYWETISAAWDTSQRRVTDPRTDTDTAAPENGTAPALSGPVAFVSVTFAADSQYASRLIVPQVLLRSEDGNTRLVHITAADTSPQELDRTLQTHGVRLDDAGRLTPQATSDAQLPAAHVHPGQRSARHYRQAVTAGLSAIAEGTVEKLVLARDVVVTAEHPIPTGALLARLARAYPQTWTYLAGEVLGATPEMLVQLRGARLFSRVLAGTVDHTADIATLLRDAKQHREHDLAVESLARQLAPVTESLHTPLDPQVLTLPNVYHLATEVTGELAVDDAGRLPGPLQVAEHAHPTAAVCGTPTDRAGQLLALLEGMDRGPYAGPVGWMDAKGNADFGIALRGGMLSADARQLRLCAGCGIVAGSEPESELAETRAKLRPMLSALGLQGQGE